MRVAKFCERNLLYTEAKEAFLLLEREHSDKVTVRVVDCFRRCLMCRVKPFCRIQLTTIEAENADILVEKVLDSIRE
ncbi:DUF1450 domain-containing protein [Ammoniphilus sp. YIM 78166]|uniref:DUF1450 domain-containing protein n=1 Tax=Ammoniphilus sp. YIM 78166 TaxID=1644106 RepID=UPI00106F3EEE|nr:DUF1450 domain-containing protein [Ammoniphilus sp. YIM 78166]